MKKPTILALLLAGTLLLAGCGQSADPETGTDSSTASVQNLAAAGVDGADMFTDRDMEIGYDAQACAHITLQGSSASADSDAVSIAGSTVTISDEGTYLLSGTLDDGMVVVDAEKTDKVQLVLDGVTIANADSAALYVREADKVFVTTAAGSSNALSNGGTYVATDENNIDAVIFSKADLTLNGAGTLYIAAAAGHGVVSKDDLALTSGTYDITAQSHGLSGKDSVRIASGTVALDTGKDGIHAENEGDTSLGFVYIADGTLSIDAQGDGISAGTFAQLQSGTFTIQAGGGSANASAQSGWATVQSDSAQEDASAKGIKAATDLILNGGTYALDCADDGLHANGNLTVSDGVFAIASGDDGIHADASVVVAGGAIDISQSYEGIEGLSIDITGGTVQLTASDDGLNAAGGNDSSGFQGRGRDAFAATEGAYIAISGGTVRISASGDGIDSNGDLLVSGGETYLSGPENSGNGSLDYSGTATISGGIFAAAGSSGMAQNFDSSSTQGAMMVTVSAGTAGSTVSLADSGGETLISWQPEKAYTCVIVSCPQMVQGGTYTLTTGGQSVDITLSSLVYGTGHGGQPGGDQPGGGRPGGGGARP